uniref:Uncharacterized protein n=1 Tax=Caenorhabditis japonica TaxID=281687 RepID=A0A8R1E2T6_CAEJA
MDSVAHRARRRIAKMLNSAVSVVNSTTLRRRSHFARSSTTNSYGPVPIDGDSSVPLMYSSMRTSERHNRISHVKTYSIQSAANAFHSQHEPVNLSAKQRPCWIALMKRIRSALY